MTFRGHHHPLPPLHEARETGFTFADTGCFGCANSLEPLLELSEAYCIGELRGAR